VFNNKPNTLLEILDNTDIHWINAGGNVLTTDQWQEIRKTTSLKETHRLQTEFADENTSFVHFKDAVNLLTYLCEGEVTSSQIQELHTAAITAQVHFYERVIHERTKDLSSEFRMTNPMFPYVSKDVMTDNICKTAIEKIAELESSLHI
jgi:hypothetical protein